MFCQLHKLIIFASEMSKKNFISTILLFTFSFVLVHNIIPHHHHDEVSEIHHGHHHDKQDHQDEEDDGLFNLFSHFSHCTTTEFSSTHFYSFQKTQIAKQLIKSVDFVFRKFKIPIKSALPYCIFISSIQSIYSTHFLRGPPVLSL